VAVIFLHWPQQRLALWKRLLSQFGRRQSLALLKRLPSLLADLKAYRQVLGGAEALVC